MNFKELVEKRNDLMTRAEEVLNSAKTEKRELTDAEAQELAEIRDDIRRIKETLKMDDDFREMKEMEKKLEGEEPKEEETEVKVEERSIEEMEKKAFEDYLRGRINERSGELTPTEGGVLIPTTIVNHIIRKVYDVCPILERSQKFNVKGNLVLPFYPANSNKINVGYQSEFVQMQSSTGSFDSVNLGGFLAGALTKVSRSLINNAQIDIVGFVVDQMAYDIARFIEHELLIGTSGSVEGLSTLSNSLTAGSATAITADDVIKLQGKVKDEFQNNAIWIMSPATRDALRTLKSQVGIYLLQDDFTAPFGRTMLGKPVYVSDNMPDIATGEKVIYYGDMHGLATKFSEDINIQVLRERYADEHAVGVIGWFEFDAKVCDEQQIAVLTMA